MPPTGWLETRFRRWVERRFDPAYIAKIEALPTRQNEYGFDSFGFHRDDAKVAALFARFFYRDYFRAETHGIENVPSGRVLIVSNHSGQLPFDAVTLCGAFLFALDPPRILRAMVERFIPTLPFVSYVFARWGQIIGTPENCRRLLEEDEAILVFPEGVKGISKPITRRYQLEEFTAGFMRLALATRAPIVPVAVVGAEEQAPAINVESLGRLFGSPAFPVVPYPPFFPILPLPTKYHLYFGEPQTFTGDPDDDDDALLEKVRVVRNRIQSMLRMGVQDRKHVFW